MSGFVASGEAVKSALSAATWIGAASPKYSHLVLSRVFDIYAEYIYANGFKLTRENLIEDFGTRPEDVDPFMKIFGGPNGIATYLTALPGIVPILPHPRNIPIIVPLFCVFTVMTSLAVGLRLWSRQKVAGGIRSFDWLALAGFGLTIIYGAVSVYHSKVSGPYQAFYDRTWDQMKENYKVYLVLTIIYPFIMGLIKISLLLFYYRVATLNYVQWAVYATGSLTIANSIAAIITHCLAFRPIDFWNHFLQSPFKFNSRTPMLVFGAVYILTDVAIWIIPMPMVFQLKLYPREKVIAVITFSLGAVACVASGFRIWAIDEFQNYSDKNSSGLMIDAWTMIELNLTLICASAPAIRALAIHYAPKILSTLPSAFSSSGATRGSKSAGSSGKSKTPESEKSMQDSQSPIIPKEVV
ncbi:hypothetical protein TWF569_010787 [Orbilia oligospora]|uniref:Rhodopsin domain-containing protein n=1 Tax=Orbilia oligospora TaxID=2813651 RepID=A0A7C8TUL9_ORBOL|nr:hypothetical protein TWF706_009611 [Orbilia oligospora]KAF3106519.1 hypothetical protein TWF102_001463 [Orbilia oligospora]KAF3106571.1 hypothetical protein TWF103_006070 [Orbilia oligospora]KAF3123166.1 hypothetical protein TWF594_002500 [Orbilia oligospora]KAF3123636.1 hypothetical protein TWF703_000713 [Orbilia oligospora]